MLTVEQAKELKQMLIAQNAVVEGTLASVAISRELNKMIDSFTAVDLEARLSPIVGIIRNMEMSHEEAVQRILKALE